MGCSPVISFIACSIELLACAWNTYFHHGVIFYPMILLPSVFFLSIGFQVSVIDLTSQGDRYPLFVSLCDGTYPRIVAFRLKGSLAATLGRIPSKFLITRVPMPAKRASKAKRS
jgi:hypothetical protein